MNPHPTLLAVLGIVLVFANSAGAALPPLSVEERNESAELVLIGEVELSRVLIHRKPGSSLYFVRLKAIVEETEKGGGRLKPGEPIDIRCWRVRKSEKNGPVGHLDIPADGSRFRMWLIQNKDGHWEPLQPNGIALLDGSPAMSFAEAERKEFGKSYLVGGLVGIAALVAFAVYQIRRRDRPR